ncbi:hypothetical protein BO71DRAFT_9491 [Aspergillus ellipticus CBS 707.79]|uniref:Uncharacterized protein n=1 Tax=Aspergillus ellipticus CBS 707.79 TaxID=1448320 RepID=A0A319DXQ5_9EURO|nr:hypothetical protein BO71DRAFT_9491 [Aspergillus ellipticus CBS 707.79]
MEVVRSLPASRSFRFRGRSFHSPCSSLPESEVRGFSLSFWLLLPRRYYGLPSTDLVVLHLLVHLHWFACRYTVLHTDYGVSVTSGCNSCCRCRSGSFSQPGLPAW